MGLETLMETQLPIGLIGGNQKVLSENIYLDWQSLLNVIFSPLQRLRTICYYFAGYNYLHSNSHLHVLKEILLNPCVVSSVVFNPVTSHVVLLPVQHRRQVRFGSKHGHLDTLNTHVYSATLWRVFEFKRV